MAASVTEFFHYGDDSPQRTTEQTVDIFMLQIVEHIVVEQTLQERIAKVVNVFKQERIEHTSEGTGEHIVDISGPQRLAEITEVVQVVHIVSQERSQRIKEQNVVVTHVSSVWR